MFSGSAAPSQLNTVLLSHDELFTIGLFVVRLFVSSLAVKNRSVLLPLCRRACNLSSCSGTAESLLTNTSGVLLS